MTEMTTCSSWEIEPSADTTVLNIKFFDDTLTGGYHEGPTELTVCEYDKIKFDAGDTSV